MRVLAVDVGGRHVKALVQGESERRRFKSGPDLTPERMVEGTLEIVDGWDFDRVSVGVPAPVADGRVSGSRSTSARVGRASTSRPRSAARRRS